MKNLFGEGVIVTLLVLALVALLYASHEFKVWVLANCDRTEEIRTVQDPPDYIDASGDGSFLVPIGGGAHEERAYLCPNPQRTVWLND